VRRSAASLALALAVLAAGCGYTLRGTLPSHLQTIAVPIFQNKTLEPAVENVLTRAVVEAFAINGRLRVVDLERADAVLEGEIIDYHVESIAFDPDANVRQYRLVIGLNLRLRDRTRNQLLFDEANLREQADFRVLGAVAETISREEVALRAAAVEIARSIVSLAVDRF
jgi:outer membrane lipopolysaccharide assembly protein LptE/RlpB